MITHQAIQERSYFIWESEGRPHGRHLEHWMRAETELCALSAPAPKRARAKRATASKADTKRSKAAAIAAAAAAQMTRPLVTH
jgi:hypothetical protein